MNTKNFNRNETAIPKAAITAGLVAMFLAIAALLMRGAILRQRTAECACKIIRAADAFDFYASAFGSYPQSQQDPQKTGEIMKGAFAAYDIDWWEAATELGGQWSWYTNGRASSVVISGARILEQQMRRLDKLLDDGDLETGAFQRHGPRYHYIIKDGV